MPRVRILTHVVLPLVILLVVSGISYWLLETGPEAKPRPRGRNATLVEVVPVTRESARPLLTALGSVIASREVALHPQVSGEVRGTSPNLIPGGQVARGEILATIDDTTWRAALSQAKADLTAARSELNLEEGNRLIADRELGLHRADLTPEERARILRQPQYDALKAKVDAAEARLRQAERDLEQTRVRAPFNATILDFSITTGGMASTSTPIATLVGSDQFWIELSLPRNMLPLLGSDLSLIEATLSDSAWQGRERTARLLHLLPDIDAKSQMIRLLAAIDDPLATRKANRALPPVLLGTTVELRLSLPPLPGVVSLDRAYVHDGNRVWLMDGEQKLAIKEVEVLFQGAERLLIGTGIAKGDHLIITPLATPVAGMPLRTADEAGGAK